MILRGRVEYNLQIIYEITERECSISMNRKNRQNRKIRMLLSAILILIMLLCAGILIFRAVQKKQAAEAYRKLQEANEQMVEQEPEPLEEPEPEKISYEGVPEVDFETLWAEVNKDICAWITMPGTAIDYPVLRNASAEDPHDAYYLEYNIDGSYGRPGTIYMEPCNSGEFTDYNTLLYGHNMHDGTMFADLHKLDDADFFEQQEYVYIVTPEKVLVYRIFAAVNYDDRHIMRTYDFSKESQRQEFLDSLHSNADAGDKFKEDVEVTAESKILTMSTCIKNKKTKRLLAEAVLVDEYER